MAAIKAVHVSDIPKLDHIPDSTTASTLYSTFFSSFTGNNSRTNKFHVIGHRGSGMNMLQSPDSRMKSIKENSIMSFNAASKFPIDFVEFDVQVTSDGCPVIFHDNFIVTRENGSIYEKRVTELTLAELLCYGPQRGVEKLGKPLLRKIKDGRIFNWNVEQDDSICTLQEAFQTVNTSLGFNIELKFDDHVLYQEEELTCVLQAILQVVAKYANERPIIFSTFQPDAAELINKLQNTYAVYFLTNGGCEVYSDVRRNSLEEAMKLCLRNGFQGIVSEVKGIFKNPGMVTKIKEANLSLLSYGQLNNVAEAVYMQHIMGVDGVIVDLVQEITEAVFNAQNNGAGNDNEKTNTIKSMKEEEVDKQTLMTPRTKLSPREHSFLLKLIPELVQH
ncbi:hypothetical protein C5167_022047 [Papaver somniferum]|uniref:glycerophosphodiester phosphodiesterase n=1 Tax=Papaver somniferum TaxID=3469 RepID=A0A4Y7JJU9_PAPSO|nr:glycerophosphodiester phosphodiesterase GDPD1, chloroplastic-like [Papaver somniferum]RZC60292.1 hypothetical protein C5167_022047 [Papaver somniferum]